MSWKFWARQHQQMAEEWIEEMLRQLDLFALKPATLSLLQRFCDNRPPIPHSEKQDYLAAAIMVTSKFYEDETWLEPSDMVFYYSGPLAPTAYKKQLIRMEKEILYCVQWKLNQQ